MGKRERPKILQGESLKIRTGCGNLYVTINRDSIGIFEIFATLGKAGSCITCQMEALTRSITLGLRYGIPVEDYVLQLAGIQCPIPLMFPQEERVLSCPDAIAKALSERIDDKYGQISKEELMKLSEHKTTEEAALATTQLKELGCDIYREDEFNEVNEGQDFPLEFWDYDD